MVERVVPNALRRSRAKTSVLGTTRSTRHCKIPANVPESQADSIPLLTAPDGKPNTGLTAAPPAMGHNPAGVTFRGQRQVTWLESDTANAQSIHLARSTWRWAIPLSNAFGDQRG